MEVVNISGEANFAAEVAKSNLPVIVDFWADWCGPCKMMTPILEEIARDYDGKIKVVKVNVEQNQNLAARFGVMSIPTLGIFWRGRETNRHTGYIPKEKLVRMIDQSIA